jgi:hypothetical protein
MEDVRIAHVPARGAYARKLETDGISIANGLGGVPVDLTFARLGAARAHDFDVLHVQTVEFATEAEIARALDGCAARGQGVVATIHDLTPCFEPAGVGFERKVDLVCTRASTVVTLTTGAADELRRSFAGRPWLARLEVIPHGRVVRPASIRRDTRAPGDTVRYGLFGSFRPSRDTWTAIVNWYYVLEDEPATLTLLTRAFDPDRAHDPSLRMAEILDFAHARRDRIAVRMRPYPTDAEVADFMREIDVLLLPYTFGSHSGQLELAFDCGVLPLAGDVGFLREQAAAAAPYVHREPIWFDWSDGAQRSYGGRFARALLEADARVRGAPGWDPRALDTWRSAQHDEILDAYARIYAAAAADPTGPTGAPGSPRPADTSAG